MVEKAVTEAQYAGEIGLEEIVGTEFVAKLGMVGRTVWAPVYRQDKAGYVGVDLLRAEDS